MLTRELRILIAISMRMAAGQSTNSAMQNEGIRKNHEGPVSAAVERLSVTTLESLLQQARLVESPLDIREMLTQQRALSSKAWVFTSATLGDDEALSWFVDNTVARRLLGVKGVGSVVRVGGVSREVQVALDPIKLQSLGATAAAQVDGPSWSHVIVGQGSAEIRVQIRPEPGHLIRSVAAVNILESAGGLLTDLRGS